MQALYIRVAIAPSNTPGSIAYSDDDTLASVVLSTRILDIRNDDIAEQVARKVRGAIVDVQAQLNAADAPRGDDIPAPTIVVNAL